MIRFKKSLLPAFVVMLTAASSMVVVQRSALADSADGGLVMSSDSSTDSTSIDTDSSSDQGSSDTDTSSAPTGACGTEFSRC